MKIILRKIYDFISKIYIFAFARPSTQKFNNLILQLALHARGYNNHGDFKTTGEFIFINHLAKMKPKLCIDIGANKGAYSEILLKATDSYVIAFEPLPEAYAIARKLEDLYPGRFIAENFGIGKEDGVLDLHYGEGDSELASFSSEVNEIAYVKASNTSVMKVPVIKLDSYLERISKDFKFIDLLKIDTEGFEYEVLLGAQRIIAELKPKFIHIEYNWHQLFRMQSLRSLGKLIPEYKVYQLLPYGDGLALRNIDLPESNIYHYSNFVFVRPDIPLS
ncbi:FkbM family methyltransferase [Limnobacter sp. SAORIC-580]|uniref:FkbM family methyltransferase n=2 Tax=Limnobacter profundi TaxID=2732163 RepID=A0ABX6N9U4_9BURK|nr:FkbM family methyltransferase [Limnobacter sp. SAORIC-580]